MARTLQHSPRESFTPAMVEKITRCGANLPSYQQSATLLNVLLSVSPTVKQLQRVTSKSGAERVAERKEELEQFRQQTLQERTAARGHWETTVVMMDGGRFQWRDQFAPRHDQPASGRTGAAERSDSTTHWREDKIGLVLRMKSDIHATDPFPEFPRFLASAPAVAALAQRVAGDDPDLFDDEEEQAHWSGTPCERTRGDSAYRSKRLAELLIPANCFSPTSRGTNSL